MKKFFVIAILLSIFSIFANQDVLGQGMLDNNKYYATKSRGVYWVDPRAIKEPVYGVSESIAYKFSDEIYQMLSADKDSI